MASISPITQRILDLDSSASLHNEGNWQEQFNHELSGYSSFNDAGVEVETGEFLYSMTRILKPHNVLETGTHWGIGAAYIGLGLKDNGDHGHLTTIEFNPDNYKQACERLEKLGLWSNKVPNTPDEIDIASVYLQDVAKFEPYVKFQLIFLDTEPQTRFAELLKFYSALDEGGYIFVHDLHRHMHQIPNDEHGFAWPYGPVPEGMKQLVREGKLRPFHFPTPRGFTGFYKVSGGDHVW